MKYETIIPKKPINKNNTIGYSYTEIEVLLIKTLFQGEFNPTEKTSIRPNKSVSMNIMDDYETDRYHSNYLQSTAGDYSQEHMQNLRSI